MPLNLHALRAFAVVVDHGGFSRAAAALHLSQPAVSKAVAGLEREVGLPLLERGARGVRLTEGGAALHALKVLLAQGRARPDDSVVVFNTGGALKYLDLLG